jgi:hypothetical protein
MRQILLAALVLGGIVLAAHPASAEVGVLGCRRTLGWSGPYVVQPYPYPAYGVPAYPVVPLQSYPVYSGYGGSYFRPDVPDYWNARRNWRDTWQDDGVKVHGYTLR